jgi:hypothetical protein
MTLTGDVDSLCGERCARFVNELTKLQICFMHITNITDLVNL